MGRWMNMLIFSNTEYSKRLQKAKESMERQHIDVLLITDPANMNYLTGYDAWSFYVHQVLIVMTDQTEPIWIGRGMDANAAKITTWLQHDNIIAYTDDYVQSTLKHPMDFVAEIIKEKGKANKTIAAEYDAYYFTAKNYIQLVKNLPNAQFVDGTSLVNWIRIVKSEKEIELIKKAATIASATMKKGIDRIEAGVRENDVVADIMHQQISGIPDAAGDYTSIVPLLPSGDKTSACHLTWTVDTYKECDPVNLELAGCHKRYHSPLARTLVLGKPKPKMAELADVVLEGMENTLDVIKPGITCEEVEQAWRTSIQKRGYTKESRIGYSTGLNYPPDWGEHTASLRPHDKTVLKPNMVFHMIPAIWFDTYGMEISETFRVTETGVEVLADVDRKLFIK